MAEPRGVNSVKKLGGKNNLNVGLGPTATAEAEGKERTLLHGPSLSESEINANGRLTLTLRDSLLLGHPLKSKGY